MRSATRRVSESRRRQNSLEYLNSGFEREWLSPYSVLAQAAVGM